MPDGPAGAEAWRPTRRSRPSQVWWALGAAALLGKLVAVAVVLLALRRNVAREAPLGLEAVELAVAGLAGLAVAGLVAAWFVRARLLRPIAALAAETSFIAEARSGHVVSPAAHPWLRPLPQAIGALADALARERARRAEEIADATRDVAEQKARLEAILRDLSEGVLVCNLDHRVLLYNQTALALLHVAGDLGLGRSLFGLVTREPVLHALERLLHREPGPDGVAADPGDSCPLVCATADSSALLSGRIALVRDAEAKATGYVLTLADVTRELAELGARDKLLRESGEGLRQPVANLRAAAETLAAFPAMDAGQRRGFDEVIQRETAVISERLEALERSAAGLRAGHWPTADILSLDLFRIVARRLAARRVATLTPIGLPLWLAADSQSLALALERLVERVAREARTEAFDAEALLGDRRVYVELSWRGAPVASATLDRWLAEELAGAPGAGSLGDVLARHGSEAWSRAAGGGRALLRLPLPAPARAAAGAASSRGLPSRPEFYDFALLRAPDSGGGRPLAELSYVVVDTETTGLRPSEGDEIVSIGAVRVVNGRILTGETFARLVNPGRSIPEGSIRFHSITDAMVADAPPLSVVLPQFRAFCGDSVLVGHNAAFDLKFIKLREAEAGVAFEMPVIDTLLLSAHLHPDLDDHDLDAIARRIGVTITGRHTALGDALATAAVFVGLLRLLGERGVDTLDELMEASRMAFKLRVNQASF